MVLKIAQGGGADSSPLSLISLGDFHPGFQHLGPCWAHLAQPHLGQACARDRLCSMRSPPRSDFLREGECVWSPLGLSVSFHVACPPSPLWSCRWVFENHFKAKLALLT